MHTRSLTISAVALLALCGCTSKPGKVDLSRGGTELSFSVQTPAGTGESRAGSDLEQAQKVAAARLKQLKVPGIASVDGRELKVKVAKSAKAEQLALAKDALAMIGRFEVREIEGGAALKEASARFPEDGDVKVSRDIWQDSAGKQFGAFMLEADTEASARKAFEAAQAPLPDAGQSGVVKLPAGVELVVERGGGARQRLYALNAPFVTSDDVKSASAPQDVYLPPEITLTFTEDAGKRFEDTTRRLVGKKIAAVVDGQILDSTVLLQPIAGGRFTVAHGVEGDKQARQREMELLAAAIHSGPLPAPLKFEGEKSFGR